MTRSLHTVAALALAAVASTLTVMVDVSAAESRRTTTEHRAKAPGHDAYFPAPHTAR